jgi:hypothetical protein
MQASRTVIGFPFIRTRMVSPSPMEITVAPGLAPAGAWAMAIGSRASATAKALEV